ncbi:MAG: accessory factor UbiK family protein [Minwuia sp.]|uniref:accessory factor UbiK family protein n=1 Tax=Minwuia sp. TaxID=2493630 RepID=UPI003A85537F
MQTRNPLFDDLSRVMTSAAGAFQGARDEVEARVRTHLERIVADMDLVDRDEFEAVKEMAANARAENERLAAEIEIAEAGTGEGEEDPPRGPPEKGCRTRRLSRRKSAIDGGILQLLA